jgi:two-component system response regulator YesN
MKIASFSYLFGMHKIIGIDDLKMVNPYYGYSIPFERNELARFLRIGTNEEIPQFVHAHRDRFSNYPNTLFHYMLIRFNLYYEISQLLEELGISSDKVEDDYGIKTLVDDFSKTSTIEELVGFAEKSITIAIENRDIRKAQKYISLIEKAKLYIRENYAKSNLQLPDVAAFVNVSTGHLSTVFNQENGVSYTDYVAEVRIQKAKELLMSTECSSSEIAFAVGYNDPHYFYNMFKKVTGMTSTAYRNSKSTE